MEDKIDLDLLFKVVDHLRAQGILFEIAMGKINCTVKLWAGEECFWGIESTLPMALFVAMDQYNEYNKSLK